MGERAAACVESAESLGRYIGDRQRSRIQRNNRMDHAGALTAMAVLPRALDERNGARRVAHPGKREWLAAFGAGVARQAQLRRLAP